MPPFSVVLTVHYFYYAVLQPLHFQNLYSACKRLYYILKSIRSFWSANNKSLTIIADEKLLRAIARFAKYMRYYDIFLGPRRRRKYDLYVSAIPKGI